jgi:hypothetical protein
LRLFDRRALTRTSLSLRDYERFRALLAAK